MLRGPPYDKRLVEGWDRAIRGLMAKYQYKLEGGLFCTTMPP